MDRPDLPEVPLLLPPTRRHTNLLDMAATSPNYAALLRCGRSTLTVIFPDKNWHLPGGRAEEPGVLLGVLIRL